MSGTMRRAARDERGQVVVLVAILFLALVFMVALVVNTGILFVERRAAQDAADAAALAGGIRLASTGNASDRGPGSAWQAAIDAAGLNGYTTGVTVNIPPTSGPNALNVKYVEVLITSDQSAVLLPQWGITTVHARAVAGGGGTPQQAIYSLGGGGVGLKIQNGGVMGLYRFGAPAGCGYDPSSTASGTPWVTVGPSPSPQVDCSTWGGNAQVNSTDSNAGTSLGNPGGLVGPPLSVSETFVGSGGTCTNVTLPSAKFPGASCTDPPNRILRDPLKTFKKPIPKTEPSPPAAGSSNWCREDISNLIGVAGAKVCDTYSGNINGCAGTLILQPGIYTGTLSGNCDYVFKPGIYVFASDKTHGINNPDNLRVLGNTPLDRFELLPGQQGAPGALPYRRDASFAACGQQSVPVNTPRCGVLLFFTYTDYNGTPSGQGCATLSISGGNTADLAPEPDGDWTGMLVYYDAYNGAGSQGEYCSGSTITVGGGAQVNGTSFRGLIYAPEADLVMQGNTSAAVLSQLIVNSINVQNALVVVNVGTAQVLPSGGLRLTE
jgi:hypothetical protein